MESKENLNEEDEFDARVAEGLSLEEFRQEMYKRIKSWDREKSKLNF